MLGDGAVARPGAGYTTPPFPPPAPPPSAEVMYRTIPGTFDPLPPSPFVRVWSTVGWVGVAEAEGGSRGEGEGIGVARLATGG